MSIRIIVLAAGLITMWSACGPAPTDDHGHDGHDHGDESVVSITKWDSGYELFVEFSPLTVGKVSQFAAHFTRLDGHQPVVAGELTVSLVVGEKGIRQTVSQPVRPGIFTPALQPVMAGTGKLQFTLRTGTGEDVVFTIPELAVYATDVEAAAAGGSPEQGGETISFLKEQAWKTGLEISPVRRTPMADVVRTTGELLPMQGDERVVSAPSAGIVRFASDALLPGRAVRKGELLFTLQPTGDPDENLPARRREAEASLKQAEAAFNRSKQMLEEGLLSQLDFEEVRLSYELAQAEMENLDLYLPEGGRKIYAPLSGFLKDTDVEPGDYVETGRSVLTITESRKLLLRADLPQKYYPVVATMQQARFRMLYDTTVMSLADFNGRRITQARRTSPEAPFLPVYFELDNRGDLLPGSFAEIYLSGVERHNILTVPRSALLEEFGTYFVMVQLSGEAFEKRKVAIGITDGLRVEIVEGLDEGDRVVTQGAYQIKMASMASSVPAHGHTH